MILQSDIDNEHNKSFCFFKHDVEDILEMRAIT